MARPVSISREQILETARAVFLQHGFGASTAQIAREAGVSEGSIFKRFPTKEALFFAAMGIPELDLAKEVDPRVGCGEVPANLLALCLVLVEFFRELVPRMSMLWARGGTTPLELCRNQAEPQPLRILKALTRYFEEEMRLGRVRATDPEILARMIQGSMHNFVFMELIGVRVKVPLQAEEYAKSVVDLLWRGAAPEAER